ncbi:MAG: TerC/Alx family metal homeostasis membrane protein, partial [Bacteroidales bacterium]|nr:TerC/Alx family metal homeostasis membrane protein [Bacteroidales bacterium]
EVLFFSGFLVLILLLLFIDLGVFSKNSHVVSLRESAIWTIVWVSLSICFYFFIRYHGDLIHGMKSIEELQASIEKYKHPVNIDGLSFDQARDAFNRNLSLQYLTGYIIEYSLSLDNVFVILLIFLSFNVPEKYYKRVLFWGILGAIVMRFIFIFSLSAIIVKFAWVMYVFGLFLVFTAVKMLMDFIRKKEEKIDVEHHVMVRLTKKFFPVHPRFEGEKFWIKKNRIVYATPLFIVLMVIEFSDLIFAVDSVPAIFAVTLDPYIVFFSNIFAIMGLRSLFFLVSHFFSKFFYLKVGLAALLAFIGLKMLTHDFIEITTNTSLIVISAILGISIIASLVHNKREA